MIVKNLTTTFMKKPITTFFVLILILVIFLIYKQKTSAVLKIGFITDIEYHHLEKEKELSAKKALLKAVSYYNYIFKPNLVVGGGDYVLNSGQDSEADFINNFNTIIDEFKKIKAYKFYALGKKDINPNYLQEVKNKLKLKETYYSKVYREFRIIILDTTENDKVETTLGTIGENQLKWLEKELSQPEPVLIFSHHSLIETPNKDSWRQNLTNQEQLHKILKDNHHKIIALFSGNVQNDYVTKKGGLPFISVGGLNSLSTFGRFSEIKITRDHQKPGLIKIDLKNHGKNQAVYSIKRNLNLTTDTRINLIKKSLENSNQKWFDLDDAKYPNGVISEKAGKEPYLNITKSGNVVVAYESEANNDKIQVKLYKNGHWLNLEDENHPQGLISLGDAGNPVVETRDEDVFVVFTEKTYQNKNRLLWWQNDNQKWVDISEKDFISDKPTHESTLAFDENQKTLFVAFAEQINPGQEQNQIKINQWNGERWENIPTPFSFFAKNWDSSLDEVSLAYSNKNNILYVVYEEITSDGKNLIQVKKLENQKWQNLNYNELYLEKISKINGFSPSLAIDKNENLYLSFVENNENRIHVYKYNQTEWLDVSPNNQTGTAIEPSITINENGIIYLAYSEFKENIVMFKESENNLVKTNTWRVRVKQFKDNKWLDCEDDFNLNGYITKGSGKGDPALKIFKENLFLVVSDEENDYKARVRKYME